MVEEFYTDEDDELNKLDGDKADKIDNLIESLNRKQEQQGIKIECETSELILLDKIQHWAKRQPKKVKGLPSREPFFISFPVLLEHYENFLKLTRYFQ